MKLIRACFKNFRLLRDVEIEFSAKRERNITIIRAANESGKTTMLLALQWALYGEEALPDGGRGFRLSPLDALNGESGEVAVAAEVEFEVPTRTGPRRYKVRRDATEVISGVEWNRKRGNVQLYEITAYGASPIDNAEFMLRRFMPKELREVFFTDGDKALRFIEGRPGEQMERVENAIRSLLGLELIEDALRHTQDVAARLNRKVKKEVGNDVELEEISEELGRINETIPKLEETIKAEKSKERRMEEHIREMERLIDDALRRGNREELEKELRETKEKRKRAEDEESEAIREHANLFRAKELAVDLLRHALVRPWKILNRMRDAGQIPNQTIPVLEDRLQQGICICGESLSSETEDGERRRKHILNLIQKNKENDELQEKLTSLFYGAQDLVGDSAEGGWIGRYQTVFARRQRASKRVREEGEAQAVIEEKIDGLPDIDVRQLRSELEEYRRAQREAQEKEIYARAELGRMNDERKVLERKRDALLKKNEKGKRIAAELKIAQDLCDVMKRSLEAMKTEELKKVSSYMESIFMKMIAADNSQRAIIRRAEITSEFRIAVFGINECPLDPAQDLNGASRRALTIAFILALTKVSGVEAPNVIDTPLGMMSGYVKRAVLEHASRESSQLILFLTPSEISGCEDILDERVGKSYTLTNPAHYPRVLVNEPSVSDARVLVCECNHKECCKICERREISSDSEGVQ